MLHTHVLQQAYDYGTDNGLLLTKLGKSQFTCCAAAQNPKIITLKNVFGSAQVHRLIHAHRPVQCDFAAF